MRLSRSSAVKPRVAPTLPLLRMQCSSAHIRRPTSTLGDCIAFAVCCRLSPMSASICSAASNISNLRLIEAGSSVMRKRTIRCKIVRADLVNETGPSIMRNRLSAPMKSPKKRSRHSRKCATATDFRPCSQRTSAMQRCARISILGSPQVILAASIATVEARSTSARLSTSVGLMVDRIEEALG